MAIKTYTVDGVTIAVDTDKFPAHAIFNLEGQAPTLVIRAPCDDDGKPVVLEDVVIEGVSEDENGYTVLKISHKGIRNG